MSKLQLQRTSTKPRRESGNVILELGLVVPLMIVCAGLALNAMIPSYGAWLNDAACRDACRVASMQTTAEKAKAAALKTLESYKVPNNTFLSSPILSPNNTEFKFEKSTNQDDDVAKFRDSYVQVTTVAKCKLIANGQEMTFKRSYIYPLVRTMDQQEEFPGTGTPVDDPNGDDDLPPDDAE